MRNPKEEEVDPERRMQNHRNKKVLISACLVGENVRYNAEKLNFHHPFIEHLKKAGKLIPVCPEVMGGMPVPRKPSELTEPIEFILKQKKGIQSIDGKDVTQYFIDGCQQVLRIVEQYQIGFAILKENSPSCGVHFIHDGHFSGTLIPGEGMLSFLLRHKRVQVFSEKELDKLIQCYSFL